MALSKDTVRDVLPSDSNRSVICKNEKKAFEYFQSLDKKKKDELIKKFEENKITSDILKTLYKKEGLDSPLFRILFCEYFELK